MPYFVVSGVTVALWYAPVASGVLSNSDQEFGEPLPWHGLGTGPFGELLVPAFVPGAGSLVVAACLAGLAAASPLLRARESAAILSFGVIGTFAVVWVGHLYVADRFVSYLLVPLLILLATGATSVLRWGRAHGAILRVAVTASAVMVFAGLAVLFTLAAGLYTSRPREAHRAAAAAVQVEANRGSRVVVHTRSQGDRADLPFYLRAPVTWLRSSELEAFACRAHDVDVVFVAVPSRVPPRALRCLDRSSKRHVHFRQYSRGGRIDVWSLPARPTPRS